MLISINISRKSAFFLGSDKLFFPLLKVKINIFEQEKIHAQLSIKIFFITSVPDLSLNYQLTVTDFRNRY